MSEATMPVAEAAEAHTDEVLSYELAFHVLPTVAEGEVNTVFEAIKAHITAAGGTCTDEEVPQHFELAYEIEQFLEGKNRKFGTAYFGWVRFTIAPEGIAAITEAVEAQKELLRYLLVKLTKVEEAHPFYFHEALTTPTVENVDVSGEDEPSEGDDTAEPVTETEAGEDDEDSK
jgi:ribosomal protein S6